MSNPHKGQTSFEADGATYMLSFSIDALCQLEEELDMSVNEIAAVLSSGTAPRLAFLRSVFWGGLRDHHPEIDTKKAGELIMQAGGAANAMLLISEAIGKSFPAPQGRKARPPKPGVLRDGTGPASSATGAASDLTQNNSGN